MNHAATFWKRLVSFAFYLLYNQLAVTYDTVSWLVSLGKWRQWQMAVVPFIEGIDVLELAHGPGHVLSALQRAGYNVVGVDLSSEMGRLARKKNGPGAAALKLAQAPGQRLPFAGQSFDTVFCTFPTAFVLEKATLDEVYRVLRPGGRLILLPEARLAGSSALIHFIDFLYRITGQRHIPEDQNPETYLTIQWRSLEQLLSESGYRAVVERVQQPGSEVTLILAEKI